MEILFILIPLSMLFVVLIGAVLFWAIRSGQYDDLERARYQILLDDDDAPEEGDEDAGGGAGVSDGAVQDPGRRRAGTS